MIAFMPHVGKVTALSFSPDGARLASVATDRSLKVWDVLRLGSSEPVWEVGDAHTHSISHCQYAWSGAVVYTGSNDGLVKSWDATDGRLVASTDPDAHPEARVDAVSAFTLSLCGRYIAYGGGHTWTPMEFAVARAADLVPVRRMTSHSRAVGVFSAWETGFASGSADRTVRLWNWESAACLGVLPLRGLVRGLTCSRDGKHIAAAGGSIIHRYAVTGSGTGAPDPVKTGDFRGHTKRVDCIEFSPDGTKLASASVDGTVRVWDVATASELRAFHTRLGPLHWIAFAPDGLTLAFSSKKGHVGLLDMDG